MITVKTHQDLEDVLMEPKAPGIKDAYFVLPGDGQNITAIVSGNNGREFNKTHGYFNESQTVEILNCLYGQGLLVMQRNAFPPEIFRTGIPLESYELTNPRGPSC